jgi:hypothetical protein
MIRSGSSPRARTARPLAGLVAAAVLTGLLATQPAAASDPADGPEKMRVLLVPMQRPDDVSSIVAGRVGDYLRTILEMNSTLRVFSPDNLEKPDQKAIQRAAETDPTLVAADAALWAAKEAANKSDFALAIEKFKEAQTLYEQGLPKLVDFDKLIDASLGVSLAYFMAGFDDNGEDALAQLLIVRPDLILDKRKVPAAAAGALERLRKMAAAVTLGTTTVESTPPGADVFIDGVRVGQTPWSQKGLVRGKHYVRVVAEGYEPFAKSWFANNNSVTHQAKLKSDGTVAANAVALPQTPEGLAVAAAKGALDAPFLKLADSIATEYGLEAIVLTYVRKAPGGYEIAPFVFDPESDKVAELEWIKVDSELASMQVNLLVLEEKLLAALAVFPTARALVGRSRIYDTLVVAQPDPVVVKPDPVVVQPDPVVVQPDPVVVQPEPSVVRPDPSVGAGLGLGAGSYGDYSDADLVATRAGRSGKKAWKWVLIGLAGAAVAGGAVAAILLTKDGGSGSTPGFGTTVTW